MVQENNFNTTISWKLAPKMSEEEKAKQAEVSREGSFSLVDERVLQAEIEEIVEGLLSSRRSP